MPVGDRRSFRGASRDGMWWGIHVGRAQRHEGWFRAPARCRSETGAPFARQPGWDVVGNSRWQGVASWGWFRAPARCRSETESFRAPAGMGCGGEFRLAGVASLALVSRSRAMPVGDRRSFRAPAGMGCGGEFRAGRSVGRMGAGAPFAASRDHVGAQRHWFRAPARCRSETGAPFARQPGWDVVGNSRWQGAASLALVSRSRAMPVGDRRSFRAPSGMGCGGEFSWQGVASWGVLSLLQRRDQFKGTTAAPGLALPSMPRSLASGKEVVARPRVGPGIGERDYIALPRDAGRRPALLSRAIVAGCAPAFAATMTG